VAAAFHSFRGQPGVQQRRIPAPGLKVLVVDDLLVNQQLLTLMMASYGHTADVAAHGQEAVRLLSEGGAYDIVLMDVQMPVMDGVTATRAIRDLPGAAGAIPIIAVTASVQPELCRSYIAAGMDDVVEKPINLDRLLAAMCKAIETQRPTIPKPIETRPRWTLIS